MTYFVIGGYEHEVGEIDLTRMNIRYRKSDRGRRMTRIDTLYLRGEIMASGSAAVLTRAAEIINAYSQDYRSCRLFMDDDTPTTHGLENDSPFNLTGVIVKQRSWPKGGVEELANMRTFEVELEAEFADNETQLLRWQEQLEFIGDCGPRVEVVETYFGPIPFTTALKTAQRVRQSGSALGFTAYVEPPGPLFPPNEHRDRQRVAFGSGKQQGQIACYFPTAWDYYFSSPIPLSGFPTTR